MPQTTTPERIAKLQQSLESANIKAAVLESGPAMTFLTGVRWGRSERTFAVVIPAKGTIAFICPGFEELRARELIQPGAGIVVWQEDESPFQKIVQALHDRGIDSGPVAFDDTTRFFVFDGVRQANPKLTLVSAQQVFTTSGVPTQREIRRRN